MILPLATLVDDSRSCSASDILESFIYEHPTLI